MSVSRLNLVRLSAAALLCWAFAACSADPATPSDLTDLGGNSDTGNGDSGVDSGEDTTTDSTFDVEPDSEADATPDAEPDVPDATPDVEPDTGECVADCFDEGASRCDGTVREVCLSEDDCLSWNAAEDCADTGNLCDAESGEALCVEEFIPTCDDGEMNGEETGLDCGGPDCDPCDDGVECLVAEDCASGVCLDDLCAAARCDDDVANGDETDVDCGGPDCGACDEGETCDVGEDCESAVCDDDVCVAASCVDGVQNGAETDVDCGADCAPCEPGFGCGGDDDCETGVCEDDVCLEATCDDGVTNGDETDTDCGGDDCDLCPTGEDCGRDGDCISGVCARDVCQAATCDDLVLNGDETGTDCGGPICDLCGVGQGCLSGEDCETGACEDGFCRRASCDDGVMNGDETGLDCGGPCDPCEDGDGCADGGDCESGVCTATVCQPPSCIDGVTNGSETDRDCGGFCPDCTIGGRCATGTDCDTGVCLGGFCQPGGCTDGVRNGTETDVDCGGSCAACADGLLCDGAVDCLSGYCRGGRCSTPGCDDRVQNGTESDIDCGGAECDPCGTGDSCVVRDDCESGICTDSVCIGATCDDALQNGFETSIDCGGPICDPCTVGRTCSIGSDCETSICADGLCATPRCDDDALNGSETDIDCGGPTCGACAAGAVCDAHSDCLSLTCVAGICSEPSCGDGIRNGTESDVDCGGDTCFACIDGGSCLNPTDCISGVCSLAVCQSAVCGDGVQNGTETGRDCGGVACDPCTVGGGCLGPDDCLSGICTDGACGAAVCDDGVQNGAETDIDCGGACDPCDVGGSCVVNGDCVSGFCDELLCAAASCDDGIRNAGETDIDCGGDDCDACADGLRCTGDSDCTSMLCSDSICIAPGCDDLILNGAETDVDCGGPECDACALGSSCAAHADCVSDVCVGFVCQEPSCDDGIQNATETDVDCGGSICGRCTLGRSCVISDDCFSGNCDIGVTGTCVAADTPTCADGEANGAETDIDCGGPACDPCAVGLGCESASDCETEICDFLDSNTCVDASPSFDVDEDWETGDFSRFDYILTGPAFEIEDDPTKCNGGSYCLRNQLGQASSTIATIETDLSIRENTTISFWASLNTEPGEHFLRFYINDELVFEESGQRPWTQYSFPVLATAAGAENTSFRWEYERSEFISVEHPAWNEVRIDDIDMPAWNTEPSIPEQTAPWDNVALTDPRPTFEWRSFDPDFDTVIYLLEYDEDPGFGTPVVVPEQTETRWTPAEDLVDGQVYYWRVKAKDVSNFRWTDWSPVWSVQIDSTIPEGLIWRQSVTAQFDTNENEAGLSTAGNQMLSPSSLYTAPSQLRQQSCCTSGAAMDFTFTGLPVAIPGTGTVTVRTCGEYGASNENIESVRIDGVHLGTLSPNRDCGDQNFSLSVGSVETYVDDGTATIRVDPSVYVAYSYCGGGCDDFLVGLSYMTGVDITTITDAISFSAFPDATIWEKLQVDGEGEITIQVLDRDGDLLPDEVLPGNSVGFTDRTVRLWDVDPAIYPYLRLQATLGPGATITDWSLMGNTRWEWRFDNTGDPEGWVGVDFGASPSVGVSGGALTFTSGSTGTDPRIEYTFPQPVDATRFTRVEVQLSTDRDYRTETVSLFWDNNFGEYDVARSIDQDEAFLFASPTIAYDLTSTFDRLPGQRWEGDIEAIRIDPLVQFLDELGVPNGGSVVFEYIAIY